MCSGLTTAYGMQKVAGIVRLKHPTKLCIMISKRDVCVKLMARISFRNGNGVQMLQTKVRSFAEAVICESRCCVENELSCLISAAV